MDTKFLLLAAGMCWLNPWIAIPYIATAMEVAKESQSYPLWSLWQRLPSNSIRLSILPYLVLAPVAYAICIVAMYGLFHLINPAISWQAVITPASTWVACCAFAAVAATLGFYFSKEGMESNVMGLIFFPLLIIVVIAMIVAHIGWLRRSVF